MEMDPKHPLHCGWELSFAGVLAPSSRRPSQWKDGRQSLPAVSYVEEWWSLWSRVTPPCSWAAGTTAFLFREGLAPEWEAWPSGGAWRRWPAGGA